jgi:hypothetical protein
VSGITGLSKESSLIVILLLAGCSYFKKDVNNFAAKVGNKVLTVQEVREVIPPGLSVEDSMLTAEDFIKKWIKQELLIGKAEENLLPVMKDVTKELINYRNSLIIYRYKNELMKQKMDTVVSLSEIERYYNENPDNFKLSTSIIKGVYIKIIKGVFNPSIVKSYCENTTALGQTELKDFCNQYAKSYGVYLDTWIEFDILLNNIPVEIDDPEDFLAKNDKIEYTDSDYYYYLVIGDYRLSNETAPLNYVSENIRSLILNQRKTEFLNRVDEDIYLEGVRNRKFTIYKN